MGSGLGVGARASSWEWAFARPWAFENATRCVSLLSRLSLSFADPSTCFSAPFQRYLPVHSFPARAAIDKRFSQRSYCTQVDAHRAQECAI